MANKELFEDSSPAADANVADEGLTLCGRTEETTRNNQTQQIGRRRVTFRSDLEDFEPEFITDIEDNDDDGISECSESDDDDDDDTQLSVLTKVLQPPPSSLDLTQLENSIVTTEGTVAAEPSSSPVAEMSVSDTAEDIDEICEEIEDFTLVNIINDNLAENHLIIGEKAADDQPAPQLHIDPSTTTSVQSDDNNALTVIDDSIRRVQSNLSTSSDPLLDIDDGLVNEEITISTKKPSPPYRRGKRSVSASATSNNCKNVQSKRGTCASASLSSNSPCSASSSDDFMKIQLNFKPCCEYKYLENNRLPRYSGYLSQYGLSKEQLERRDVHLERCHQRRYQRIERKTEELVNKSQENEEAFARWLQVKMRNTRATTHTKNMYDFYPPKMSRSSATMATSTTTKSSIAPQKKKKTNKIK